MQKLSITRAWEEALGVLKREGSLLFPVAVALIGLPIVLFQLVVPQPVPGTEPQPGAWMLYIIPLALVAATGSLAITLLALRSGISVGEALATGLRRLVPLLLASLLLMVVLGAAVFLIVMVLAVVVTLAGGGAAAASVLTFVIFVPLFAFVWARLMMLVPVAVVESASPIGMLKRSWALARGHTAKLLGFAILVSLGAGVIIIAVTVVFGSLIALALGRPEPANLSFVLLLLVGGSLNAIWGAFYAVIVARIYAQLAGEPTSGI